MIFGLTEQRLHDEVIGKRRSNNLTGLIRSGLDGNLITDDVAVNFFQPNHPIMIYIFRVGVFSMNGVLQVVKCSVNGEMRYVALIDGLKIAYLLDSIDIDEIIEKLKPYFTKHYMMQKRKH